MRTRTRTFALPRARMAGALAAAMLLAATGTALGNQPLAVTAMVLKSARLTLLEQPETITVRATDVERGYVEVAGGRITVTQNSGGYMLIAESTDVLHAVASRMHMRGNGVDVHPNQQGTSVMQLTPGRGMQRSSMNLEFRFELPPSTRPGVYQWPVRLSVNPL